MPGEVAAAVLHLNMEVVVQVKAAKEAWRSNGEDKRAFARTSWEEGEWNCCKEAGD